MHREALTCSSDDGKAHFEVLEHQLRQAASTALRFPASSLGLWKYTLREYLTQRVTSMQHDRAGVALHHQPQLAFDESAAQRARR